MYSGSPKGLRPPHHLTLHLLCLTFRPLVHQIAPHPRAYPRHPDSRPAGACASGYGGLFLYAEGVEHSESRSAHERQVKDTEVLPKALDCAQPCCRFPKVQPAARHTATKSPSLQDMRTYEQVSPLPQQATRVSKVTVQGRSASGFGTSSCAPAGDYPQIVKSPNWFRMGDGSFRMNRCSYNEQPILHSVASCPRRGRLAPQPLRTISIWFRRQGQVPPAASDVWAFLRLLRDQFEGRRRWCGAAARTTCNIPTFHRL